MKKLIHDFLYKRSLTFQISTIIFITILLPVLIVGIASTVNVSKSNTSLTLGTVKQISSNVTSEFNALYSNVNLTMMKTSVSDDVRNYLSGIDTDYGRYLFHEALKNDETLNQLFDQYSILEGITFVRTNGDTYTYSSASATSVDYNSGSSSAVNRLLDQYSNPEDIPNLSVVSSEFPSVTGGSIPYISFVRCVRKNNRLLGFALINCDASMLKNRWYSVNTHNIEVQILHKCGTVIYDDDPGLINKTSDLSCEQFDDQSDGNFISKMNGVKYMFVYNTAKDGDCMILTRIPMSILRAPANNVVLIITITCILMILFTFTISSLLLKTILQPALILRDYVRNFSKGNFEQISEEFPQNEIGELADAYNFMTRKISEMIEQVYKAEIEKGRHALAVKQAELQAMQMQINPHFIYNTLSTISAHAILTNNTAIEEMVSSLSSLMRYSLGKIWISPTLKEEVTQLHAYFNIQSYRRSVMPEITIDITGYEECVIIRLLLQPIVENIFTHAFPEGMDENSRIEIKASGEGSTLLLRVSDNGCGISDDRLQWLEKHIEDEYEDDSPTGGIGIRNVHKRIQLMYGSEYGLKISNNPDGGTAITALMPLKEKSICSEQSPIKPN